MFGNHADLTGDNLHESFHYVSDTDPGAVGAGKYWLDTTSAPFTLKRRNDTDDGWIEIGGSGGEGGSIKAIYDPYVANSAGHIYSDNFDDTVLAAKWQNYNAAQATNLSFTETEDYGLEMLVEVPTTGHLVGIYEPVTIPVTDYTLTAYFGGYRPVGGSEITYCLCFFDDATDPTQPLQLVQLRLANNAATIRHQSWYNSNTYNFENAWANLPNVGMIWVRYNDYEGSIQYSLDGGRTGWTPLSGANLSEITAIGFCVIGNGSFDPVMNVRRIHWEADEPFSPLQMAKGQRVYYKE